MRRAKRGSAAAGRRAALAAMVLFAASPALAQVDCSRLGAEIESLSRPPGAARYEAAAIRQRVELDRTIAYAQQLGCGGGFFNFGRAPAQCAAVEARIRAISINLQQLEDQAARAAASAGTMRRRAALQQQYETYCLAPRGGDPFDESWGAPGGLRSVPVDPGEDGMEEDWQEDAQDNAQGGNYAVCVRTCDGGYFPLGLSPRRDKLDVMDELCQARCPNTEARLYTMRPSGDIGEAVNIEGAPYTDLPNAFRYRKTFERTCTCKPPTQGWASALMRAEEILNSEFRGGKADALVTPEEAQRLSRPKAEARPAPVRPPGR